MHSVTTLISDALERVMNFENSPGGKDIRPIQETISKVEKRLTAMIDPSVSQCESDFASLKDLVPAAVGNERHLFDRLEDLLRVELEAAHTQLGHVRVHIDVAVALAAVWAELDGAEDLIALRTSAEKSLVIIPHPLSPECNEEFLSNLEASITAAEGTVTEWQRASKRAKAERAVAQLKALLP
ncbi:hypothetical protein HK405_015298, partial [Cladochytrium tenue]